MRILKWTLGRTEAKGMMVGGDGMGWLPLVGREGECLGQSEGWN